MWNIVLRDPSVLQLLEMAHARLEQANHEVALAEQAVVACRADVWLHNQSWLADTLHQLAAQLRDFHRQANASEPQSADWVKWGAWVEHLPFGAETWCPATEVITNLDVMERLGQMSLEGPFNLRHHNSWSSFALQEGDVDRLKVILRDPKVVEALRLIQRRICVGPAQLVSYNGSQWTESV